MSNIKVKIVNMPYLDHPVGDEIEFDDKFAKLLVLMGRMEIIENEEPVRVKRKYTRRDMRAQQ